MFSSPCPPFPSCSIARETGKRENREENKCQWFQGYNRFFHISYSYFLSLFPFPSWSTAGETEINRKIEEKSIEKSLFPINFHLFHHIYPLVFLFFAFYSRKTKKSIKERKIYRKNFAFLIISPYTSNIGPRTFKGLFITLFPLIISLITLLFLVFRILQKEKTMIRGKQENWEGKHRKSYVLILSPYNILSHSSHPAFSPLLHCAAGETQKKGQ